MGTAALEWKYLGNSISKHILRQNGFSYCNSFNRNGSIRKVNTHCSNCTTELQYQLKHGNLRKKTKAYRSLQWRHVDHSWVKHLMTKDENSLCGCYTRQRKTRRTNTQCIYCKLNYLHLKHSCIDNKKDNEYMLKVKKEYASPV